MKDRTYLLNTLLAGTVGTVLLAAVIARSFVPNLVLPELNIPAIAALSLTALLLEAYLAPDPKRHWLHLSLLGAVTFGLLPWAAGLTGGNGVWQLALTGGVCFAVITWLFDSMHQRMASAGLSRISLWIGSFGLFLACQCFVNIIL